MRGRLETGAFFDDRSEGGDFSKTDGGCWRVVEFRFMGKDSESLEALEGEAIEESHEVVFFSNSKCNHRD